MAIELSRDKRREQASGKAEQKSRVERISAALTTIEEEGITPGWVAESPGEFLFEFYKAWLANGGQDGGKNRNSIRRMRDIWLTGDHEVKSLHPKLTGRIRISREDAKSLMTLFLGRWKFVGVKETDWIVTPDGYVPFPCKDCHKLCDQLADIIYPEGTRQAVIGLRLPIRPGEHHSKELESDWDEVARLYLQADAVVNLSRHKTAVGITPVESIKNFWEILRYLYENSGEKDVLYIWIVDIGSRQAEDEDSGLSSSTLRC